jgi:hypothetical protein
MVNVTEPLAGTLQELPKTAPETTVKVTAKTNSNTNAPNFF